MVIIYVVMCPQRKVPNLETLQKVPMNALGKVPISLLGPTQIYLQQVWTGSDFIIVNYYYSLRLHARVPCPGRVLGATKQCQISKITDLYPWRSERGGWDNWTEIVLGHPLQLCLTLQKSKKVNFTSLPFAFIPFADYGEKSIFCLNR